MIKLNVSEKLQICRLRWEGMSYREIEASVGISKQVISLFIKGLPYQKSTLKPPNVSENDAMEVMERVLCGWKIEQIATTLGIDKTDCQLIIDYICTKKNRTILRNSYYPAIVQWMRREGVTMQEFADRLRKPKNYLIRVLTCKNGVLLPYDLAMRISELTGLTISEIYSVLLQESGVNSTVKETEEGLTVPRCGMAAVE